MGLDIGAASNVLSHREHLPPIRTGIHGWLSGKCIYPLDTRPPK